MTRYGLNPRPSGRGARQWAATNVAEGRFWLRRLLAAAPPDALWSPYAMYALGYLGYWSGDADSAVRDLRAAVSRLDGSTDSYAARALIYLAGLLDDQDRVSEAIECVRSAIEAAKPFGIDLQVAVMMGNGQPAVRARPRPGTRPSSYATPAARRSSSLRRSRPRRWCAGRWGEPAGPGVRGRGRPDAR
jgi:tetratricopeptide (TPR) repeat protein